MLDSALRLGAFALVATVLLGGMVLATRDRIAAAEREAELQAMAALLPAEGYDNDPLLDVVRVVEPESLGTPEPVLVHRVRRGGQPVAAVLELVAPDGYSGPIHLLLGVDMEGRVIGVRVTRHHETPGLGDPIDSSKSDWARGFEGRSLGDPPPARWTVRKEGGDFDQFAGATISPRAVVKAVRRGLAYFRDNREQLFARPTEPER
jgi:electron transport complex protein RnfG